MPSALQGASWRPIEERREALRCSPKSVWGFTLFAIWKHTPGIKGTRGRSNSIFEPPHHPGNHSKVFWYVLFVCLFSRFGRAGCTSLAPAMLAIACNDMHLHSNVTKHDRTNNHGGLAPQRLHGMSHGHGASMCTGQKIQPRPPTDIMQM